jgi:hypothetical protein
MRDHFGPGSAPVNEILVLTSKNEINVRGDIHRVAIYRHGDALMATRRGWMA